MSSTAESIDALYRSKSPREIDEQESLNHYLSLKINGYLAVATICSEDFTSTFGKIAAKMIEPHTEDSTQSAVLGPLVYELEDEKFRVMTYGCAYYVLTEPVAD